LTLARKSGIATITDAHPKYVSEGLAKLAGAGLTDCLRRTLVGRDLPEPDTNGPAELAILVSDAVITPIKGHEIPSRSAGRGSMTADGQAPFLGERDAKLVVTVFTDFQCPFCWTHAARLQSLAELYPGQIRIDVRNDPMPFHAQGKLAA